MNAKVPRRPQGPLRLASGDVITCQPVLWRIHRTTGAYLLAWNQLRTYGPLTTMRWDPQPPPTRQGAEGVSYTATTLATALAETFQATRVVDTRSFSPRATAWQPVRPLHLLDLTGTWALRNQSAAALTAAPRSVCRAWANAIRTTWPDLDGLHAPSTMTGSPNVILFTPAADTYPASPDFSQPLSHPTMAALVAAIAIRDLGYSFI